MTSDPKRVPDKPSLTGGSGSEVAGKLNKIAAKSAPVKKPALTPEDYKKAYFEMASEVEPDKKDVLEGKFTGKFCSILT